MAKEEFFNFLSLINAFKDVVIGEDQIILTESLISSEIEPQKQVAEENNDYLKLHANPIEENNEKITAFEGDIGKFDEQITLKNTEILIINKDEAIDLVSGDENLKLDFNEINNIEILTGNIKKWGPKIVVITDGPEGAYVYDGENILFSSVTYEKIT